MKVPSKSELPHKLAMYRLLTELLEDAYIATNIYFKGGTCASMLGYLDRFSVDLDFDLLDSGIKKDLRNKIHKIFKKIDFKVKDESVTNLQFFLKYRDVENERSTLKLEITDIVSQYNKYEKVHLDEIDKFCQAQTIETMFANKLVALKARWNAGRGISGRDLYDIRHFFSKGYEVNKNVVEDLTGKSFDNYIQSLVEFVKDEVKESHLNQDLNPLLRREKLNKVVPYIKKEVLVGLKSVI